MRAGIPTHAQVRFEAQRDAQARRARRWERAATLGLVFAILATIGLWLAVVLIALHFLGKAW